MMTRFEDDGQIEKFAQDIGCKTNDVIDLSSNINFIKPNINIDLNSLDISSYPSYDKLYEKIALNYGVTTKQIELFNGCSSLIFSLFNYLDLKYCTIYSPSILDYKQACVNFTYELRVINRFENINLPVKDGSLVIFMNPSIADGIYYDLDNLMNYWIEKNCTILIDERCLDFCDGASAIEYIEKYDKLYILKSMTEFYSSAGIRVATIISNEKNIDSLKRFEPQWKLSQFDSNYLQSALDDLTFKKLSKAINTKNRILLENVLEDSPLISSIYRSNANYILAKLSYLNIDQFQEKLKPFKIMVRDCTDFDFLDESWVRISVKSSHTIESLKRALDDIMEEIK